MRKTKTVDIRKAPVMRESTDNESAHHTLQEVFDATFARLLAIEGTDDERACRLLVHSEFFGEATGKASRRQDRYVLPKGFEDWKEWETIVVSTLNARVLLILSNSKSKPDLLKLSLERVGMVGGFEEGIDTNHWTQIFAALQKDGSVAFEDALSFFRRIDGQRDNFKSHKTYPIPRRQRLMVKEWIHLGSDARPSLCLFDNASGGLLLACYEKDSDDDGSCGISGQNFSREKAKLGLVSCKKPSKKAEFSSQGIIVSDR